MTEREYDGLLEAVQEAINPAGSDVLWAEPVEVPTAANDNRTEWPLTPFPEGWIASP